MNNTRSIIMLIVAILAGLGAAIMASKWLVNQGATGEKVTVAAVDINLGQKLTPDMLKIVDWPSGSVPAESFKNIADLDGRVLKASLLVGEPVIASKLAPKGSQGGLSAVIAEGKRAITVRVNDVVGVAGFALPGNYVDIIVNTDKDVDANNHAQSISKTVLEKILVLAVEQEVGRDDTKPKVVNAVTLEVTPEQAEMIDLARSVGNLSLVLRNQVDVNPSTTAGATKNSLLSIRQAEKPVVQVVAAEPKVITKTVIKSAAPVTNKQCVKVITGLSSSLECF